MFLQKDSPTSTFLASGSASQNGRRVHSRFFLPTSIHSPYPWHLPKSTLWMTRLQPHFMWSQVAIQHPDVQYTFPNDTHFCPAEQDQDVPFQYCQIYEAEKLNLALLRPWWNDIANYIYIYLTICAALWFDKSQAFGLSANFSKISKPPSQHVWVRDIAGSRATQRARA